MFTNGNCATNFTMPVMPASTGYTGYGLPVMPVATGYGGEGWGNDWISLAIIAMIFGWGGFGYGGFGGGNGVVTNGDLQRGFDTQSVTNKLNGLENGMCSLGYDQLAQMNGINTNIMQTGYSLERAAQSNAIANMQNQFETIRAIDGNTTAGANNTGAIISAIKDCCCDEQMRGMTAEYNAQTRARNITDTANANTRAILEKLCAMENNAKDAKIDELSRIVNNQYLLSQINKTPVPAYVVQNPYCNCNNGYPYGYYGGTAIA